MRIAAELAAARRVAKRLLGLGAGILLAGSSVASAQDHPNRQHGFNLDSTYAGGDVDTINVFNGHLMLRIPLGIAYPVASGFDYQFQLVYNSSPWEFHPRSILVGGQQLDFTRGYPDESSNAGLGWQLSFGRLDLPGPRPDEADHFSYIAEGGSTHLFYDTLHHGDPPDGDARYTRDGSYLRLKPVAGGWTVEFPDGKVHTFDSQGRLTEIADRHRGNGAPTNWLRFDYSLANTWMVTDSRGRSHAVSFVSGGPDMAGPVVSSLSLSGFGGSPAAFAMTYATTPVTRPCPHDDANDGAISSIATVPLLTRIALPDGSTYEMPASDYITSSTALATCRFPGSIRGLELPTGGRLEWTYQVYSFPDGSGDARQGLDKAAGVATRTMKQGGVSLGTWTYATVLNPPRGPVPSPNLVWEDLVNTVTDPLSHSTKHYFSVYAEAPNAVDPEGYENEDYGLPFTREASDGGGRFLSTEVFDSAGRHLRSTYVRFERDQVPAQTTGLSDATNLNRRLQSTKTVFHTPAPGDTELFAEVSYSRFDGLGTYRRADTSGNFQAGNSRTTVTEVNVARGDYQVDRATNSPAPGFSMLPPSAPWLLSLPESHAVTEGGKTARTRFVHDQTTGFLTSRRVLKEWTGSDSCGDLLVTYLADASGNVVNEKHFGGDAPGLCPGGPPAYEIAHTYQHGVRATSQFLNGNGTAMSFRALDLTIDPWTGLPSSRRDTAGVAVQLLYDTSGRLTAERPSTGSGAWRSTCYARVGTPSACQQNSPSGANVVVRSVPNGSTTGPAHTTTQSVFDGFGRLAQQRRRRAGGWDVQTNTYDRAGNLASQSQMVREGATAHATRYFDYDPFGRPGKVTAADGNDTHLFYEGVFSLTRMSRVGTQLAGTAVIQEDVQRSQRFDRQGRLWKVFEPANADGSDTETTYAYDPLDQLVEVNLRTSAGTQIRTFGYDARGFQTFENMPERSANVAGLQHDVDYLSYDPMGRPTRIVDGSNDLRYTFDRAGRPVEIKEPGVAGRMLATFTYGTGMAQPDLSNGKLKAATRFNYHIIAGANHTVAITQTHVYGGRAGALSRRDLSMAFNGQTGESFTQGWRWNDLGLLESVDYPQCTFGPCTEEIPDSFEDVAANSPDRAAIEALFAAGVTSGCAVDPMRYCPATLASRRDAAVLVLRALEGRGYQPPPATGTMFNDVPLSDWGAPYIEEFARRQFTSGCGNGSFCPDAPTTNAQMAVFLLRATNGSSFLPPSTCTGTGFTDVSCSHPFATWIQELSRQRRTDGCGGGKFCPDDTVNRAAIADVLVDGFFLPRAQSPSSLRTVDFGHADGLLTAVPGYAAISHHPNGLVHRVDNINGLHWEQGNDPHSIPRTGSIALTGTSTASLGSYGYDGDGNLVSMGGSRFVYDRAGRLARGSFDSGQFQAYSYDGFGNLLTTQSNVSGFGRNTPTDPTTNRLAGATAFDASGNLRAWNGATYEYDAFNQMRRFVSGGQEWLYSYDAFGERVWAHRPAAGTRLRIDRWTLRDLDGRPLRMYEGSDFGWRIDRDYVYRNRSLLASDAPSEGLRFFYLDHLGSPRQIANRDGAAVSGHHYFPFGEELAPTGRERMKFTGHERDLADAGSTADDLDYMHARHYNPLTGRFTSVDPAASASPVIPQSWNRYAYVRNSPLVYVDPDGRQELPAAVEETLSDVTKVVDGWATLSKLAMGSLKAYGFGAAPAGATIFTGLPRAGVLFGTTGIALGTGLTTFQSTRVADKWMTRATGDDLALEKSIPWLNVAAYAYEYWRDPEVSGDVVTVRATGAATVQDLVHGRTVPVGGDMVTVYPPGTINVHVSQMNGSAIGRFLAGQVCWEGVCLAPAK
jgi:RHS repeat-associated protein